MNEAMGRVLGLLVLAAITASRAPAQQPATPPPADAAPVTSLAPDPVPPTAELAPLLARFDGEADPGRALKRAFVATVHYLLARDLERLLPHFHPELRFHIGGGDFDPLPPDALRALFTERLAAEGNAGPKRRADQVLDLASVRAYSRARARDADRLKEGWETDPRAVARLMADDDWLVMGKLTDPEWGKETFYVFRKDGSTWKVVLAE